MTCKIIAEAGVNHGGDLSRALRLADAAREAGADAVKFQTFAAERLLRRSDPLFQTIKALELPQWRDYATLSRHCASTGIEFLSTPGDPQSLRFLVEECGVQSVKIGSDDMLNRELIEAAGETGLPLLISTGMADIAEVNRMLTWLPEAGCGLVVLMHCVSLYPCPPELANLRAMQTMEEEFDLPVGYSDHCQESWVALAAVARDAAALEKHLMLDDGFTPVDAQVSVFPGQLAALVRSAREFEGALGHGRKEPSLAERKVRDVLRKGRDGLRGPLEGAAA